jgi:hypothetical protein
MRSRSALTNPAVGWGKMNGRLTAVSGWVKPYNDKYRRVDGSETPRFDHEYGLGAEKRG